MILDDIFEERKLQLSREKARCKNDLDFKKSLTERHIIAEVKKASPSKSVIAEDFYPVETALMYEQYGASAISVLTEEKYFQGSSLYLSQIREKVNIPLLRKDFIFDEFQIAEAAVLGANAVLLIAAMLSAERFGELYVFAEKLNLQCLCEVHTEEEFEKILPFTPDIVGVNNRNLKDFTVSLTNTERLVPIIKDKLPNAVVVSESGIASVDDYKRVRGAGADAVLIGETFMRSKNLKDLFGLFVCS